MRVLNAGRLIVGSSVIYVVMAACGSSSSSKSGTGAPDAHDAVAENARGTGGSGGQGVGGSPDGSGLGGDGMGGGDGSSGDSSAVADASMDASVHDANDSSLLDALTDPVPEAQADASGSRLKGKFLLGADGSKQYERGVWYDSQRQTDCTFEKAADGAQRCLPVGHEEGYYYYYKDAGCTQLFIAYPPVKTGCTQPPPPEHLRIRDPEGYCSAGPADEALRVYALVGTLSSPPAQAFDKNGSCQPTVRALPPTWLLYEYGPEIAPTSFVAGTAAVDP